MVYVLDVVIVVMLGIVLFVDICIILVIMVVEGDVFEGVFIFDGDVGVVVVFDKVSGDKC